MSERILIVDDERKICNILTHLLGDEGYTVKTASNGDEAISMVDSFDPALILMDQNMPGMDGIETMEKIREKRPGQTVVVLTAYGSIPRAVDAIRKGAYDYIAKPFDNDELLLNIRRAIERNRMAAEISDLRRQLSEKYSFDTIVGVSAPVQRMFEQMRLVCDTDATVLVQGESGTGKELVVRAIHFRSSRKNKPFVAVNCGAIPANLIESEFFGHEKGAFTDAKERRIGKFEQAHGGTIFFDEVGELPPDAQVKLLRVLEDRTITRIGGGNPFPVDVRIMAATNVNLDKAVKDERFRTDLLYRLNIFTIDVPPLRNRREDIPLLIEHFLKKFNGRLGLSVESVSRSALSHLESYGWPGNIRDLENAVQSAMIRARSGVIGVDHLPLRIRGFPELQHENGVEEHGIETYMNEITGRFEKEFILKSLDKNRFNRTATAEDLGISRKTLFNKMKQYGINGTGGGA